MEPVTDLPEIAPMVMPGHLPDFRELMEAYVAIFTDDDCATGWLHCLDLQNIDLKTNQ